MRHPPRLRRRRVAHGADAASLATDAIRHVAAGRRRDRGPVGALASAVDRISDDAARARADMTEVVAVAEQSSASTEQVSASTRQTGAPAQEISASAQEPAATAEQLEALVRGFKVVA